MRSKGSRLPYFVRVLAGRLSSVRSLRDLFGRWGLAGFHAYVAPGVGARHWGGVELGSEAHVARGTYFQVNDIDGRKHIVVGERAWLGLDCYFSAGNLIEIGDDVLIGARCAFLGAGHDTREPGLPYARAKVVSYGDIVLEQNVWIGVGATVIGDVRIGYGSIVAAGSVVLDTVPPLCLVAGHPATVRRTFDWQTQRWLGFPAGEDAEARLARHMASLPGRETFVRLLAERRSREAHP